jgi:hypothetical protein
MLLITSLAVEKCCTLKQGDCKNALCQGIFPDDKITFIKPPIGDPNVEEDAYWLLKRTIYGLCRSPCHWYTKIKSILKSIGLCENASDPCLFTGHVFDPSNPKDSPSLSALILSLYVDDFVYFPEDAAIERKFEALLSPLVSVEFIGANWTWCYVIMTQCHQPTTPGAETIQTESSNHEQINGIVSAPGGVG